MTFNLPFLYTLVLENYLTAPDIKVTWTDPNDEEENYLVEKSVNGVNYWLNIVILGASVTTYTDFDVTYGNSYYYRVRAYKGSPGPPGDYTPYSPIRAINVPLLDDTPGVEGGGIDYGIQQFYGASEGYHNALLLCKDCSFVNNHMYNNGIANIDPDILDISTNVTIDNPSSESFQMRRGVLITP